MIRLNIGTVNTTGKAQIYMKFTENLIIVDLRRRFL